MGKIFAIALNSYRENIRDRIFYNLLVFALLMILLSIAIIQLSTGEWQRVATDVGMGSISIFSSLIAIFLGVSLVNKEIEKRTIYNLLSKPVSRYQFVLGKFFGLVLTLMFNILIMFVVYILVMRYLHLNVGISQFQAVVLIFMKLMIVVAIAIFFSSFTTSTLSAIFTLSIFVIGHLTEQVKFFGERSELSIFRVGSKIIYYLIPNLSNYTRLESATYGLELANRVFFEAIGIGFLTTALILVFAIIIFERRDFV